NCPTELAIIIASHISNKMSTETMDNEFQQPKQQQQGDNIDHCPPPTSPTISSDDTSTLLPNLISPIIGNSALASIDVAKKSREMVDEYIEQLGSNPEQTVEMVQQYMNNESSTSVTNEDGSTTTNPTATTPTRSNGFVSSISAVKNGRKTMEDRHIIIHDLNKALDLKCTKQYSYYAVFDGHAGVDAASYSTAHLHHNLVETVAFAEGRIEDAFAEAFEITDRLYIKRYKEDGIDQLKPSGTTALCALIEDHKTVYLAWVGDSQAVLVRNGCHEEIMLPHKPDLDSERIRIQELGGLIVYVDTWRVNGVLSVTRAIGDPEFKPYVIAQPSMSKFEIDPSLDFLVLGCDGLFDQLTGQDITSHVFEFLCKNESQFDKQTIIAEVSNYLSNMAIREGSNDNITSIVLFFKPYEQLVATSYDENDEMVMMLGEQQTNGQNQPKEIDVKEGDDEMIPPFSSSTTEPELMASPTTILPTTNGGHFPYTDFSELPIGANINLHSLEAMSAATTTTNPTANTGDTIETMASSNAELCHEPESKQVQPSSSSQLQSQLDGDEGNNDADEMKQMETESSSVVEHEPSMMEFEQEQPKKNDVEEGNLVTTIDTIDQSIITPADVIDQFSFESQTMPTVADEEERIIDTPAAVVVATDVSDNVETKISDSAVDSNIQHFDLQNEQVDLLQSSAPNETMSQQQQVEEPVVVDAITLNQSESFAMDDTVAIETDAVSQDSFEFIEQHELQQVVEEQQQQQQQQELPLELNTEPIECSIVQMESKLTDEVEVSSSANPFSSEPMDNIIDNQHIDGDGTKPFNLSDGFVIEPIKDDIADTNPFNDFISESLVAPNHDLGKSCTINDDMNLPPSDDNENEQHSNLLYNDEVAEHIQPQLNVASLVDISRPFDQDSGFGQSNYELFDKAFISNDNSLLRDNRSDTTILANETIEPDHELISNNNSLLGLEENTIVADSTIVAQDYKSIKQLVNLNIDSSCNLLENSPNYQSPLVNLIDTPPVEDLTKVEPLESSFKHENESSSNNQNLTYEITSIEEPSKNDIPKIEAEEVKPLPAKDKVIGLKPVVSTVKRIGAAKPTLITKSSASKVGTSTNTTTSSTARRIGTANTTTKTVSKPSTMATGKPKPSVASAKPSGVITTTKPVLLKNRPVATSTRTTTVSKSIAGTVNGTRTVPTSSSTSRAPLSSKPSTTHTVTARKPLSGITSTTGTRVKDTTRPPLTQPAAKVPAATITTKPVVKTTRTRTVPSSSSSTTTSTRARTVPSTTTTTRTRTVQSTTTAVSKVGSIRSVATKSTAPTPSTRAVSKPANKMPSSTATNGVKAVPKKPITKVSDNKVTSSTSTVPSSTNGKPNVISIKRNIGVENSLKQELEDAVNNPINGNSTSSAASEELISSSNGINGHD
ncbi:Protein phosphatase 1E, partial [Blomia tropicalis]